MIFGIIVIVVYVQPLHAPYAPLSFSPGQETFSCLNVIMAIREYLSFSLSVLSVRPSVAGVSLRHEGAKPKSLKTAESEVCVSVHAQMPLVPRALSSQAPPKAFILSYKCQTTYVLLLLCFFLFAFSHLCNAYELVAVLYWALTGGPSARLLSVPRCQIFRFSAIIF